MTCSWIGSLQTQKAGIGSFRATRQQEEEGPPHLKVQISSSSLQSVVKNRRPGQDWRCCRACVPLSSSSPQLSSCDGLHSPAPATGTSKKNMRRGRASHGVCIPTSAVKLLAVSLNYSIIKNWCHLQNTATYRRVSFTHPRSLEVAERATIPGLRCICRSPRTREMIYTKSTTNCHIAKWHFSSSFAIFQTLTETLSHTLMLIHELSWNRIKEKVHTQEMPCQIIFLSPPTGTSSEEPSLCTGVMETQQFPSIVKGCNCGLGQPAKASLQAP